jgi:choline kinase
MKTITLCAGMGSRLSPLTDNVPKCLVKYNDKSILDHQLDVFYNCSLHNNSVVTGYLQEKITQKVRKFHNPLYETTNMVYSLSLARELFDGEEDVIVSYGDIIYQRVVLQKLLNSKVSLGVVADLNWENYWSERLEDYWSDVESFQVDSLGYVQSIGQRWKSKTEIQGQYIGLIKFSSNIHSTICERLDHVYNDPDLHNIYMTDFLQSLINEGNKVNPVFISSGWLEFDQVSDVDLKFQSFLNEESHR